MEPEDVVRVLDDRYYGFAPVGAIDQIVGAWARVKFDEPARWGREHSWFMLEELEKVDIERWEKAMGRGAA